MLFCSILCHNIPRAADFFNRKQAQNGIFSEKPDFRQFDWGSKGREFESLYPDHFFACKGKKWSTKPQGFSSQSQRLNFTQKPRLFFLVTP